MLTAAKYAKMGEEVMSFTKELLHSQIHAVAQTISPGPTVSLLNRENLLAAKQKEHRVFASAA